MFAVGVELVADATGTLVATAGVDADVFTAVALTRALVQLWGGGGGRGTGQYAAGAAGLLRDSRDGGDGQ